MFRPVFLALCLLLSALPAIGETPTKRFIPVELWAGATWDGRPTLTLPQVDFAFGRGNRKRIRGPAAYTRPGTGETLQVYERTDRGKTQYFTVSKRGDGLGRVFDNRYDRNCEDEVKFPLGWWQAGETRRFAVRCNGGAMTRHIALTILDLDYRYNGVDGSLRYRWTVEGCKSSGCDNIYTYSPGLGNVRTETD